MVFQTFLDTNDSVLFVLLPIWSGKLWLKTTLKRQRCSFWLSLVLESILNREKHGEPAEVSSFQGGFNRPREYPDLVFDDRSIVVDGAGLRNIGTAPQKVKVTLACGGRRRELNLRLAPGNRVDLERERKAQGLTDADEFTIEVSSADGRGIASERYLLVAPPKKEEVVVEAPEAEVAPTEPEVIKKEKKEEEGEEEEEVKTEKKPQKETPEKK